MTTWMRTAPGERSRRLTSAMALAALFSLSLLAIACGGAVNVVAHPPALGAQSAVRSGKIGTIEVRVHEAVTNSKGKRELLVEHDIPERLRKAIQLALEQGGYYAPGGPLQISAELSDFRVKSAMWAGPGMGPDIAWLRVQIRAGGQLLKAYEAKSVDLSGNWSTSTRISRMFSDVAQQTVNGI